jgi:hypothetical protein
MKDKTNPRDHGGKDTTKDIWGMGHRKEYVSRLKGSGRRVAKGPYQLDRFWAQEIPFNHRTLGWTASYTKKLRNLALNFWVGSEFDIAIIGRDSTGGENGLRTTVFHEFDAMTNTVLQLKHGFDWDGERECHVTNGEFNNLKLITNLLTYYNAVFFDDAVAERSRIYYHNVLPMEIPTKIRIWRGQANGRKYVRGKRRRYKLLEYRRGRDANFEKVVRPRLRGWEEKHRDLFT